MEVPKQRVLKRRGGIKRRPEAPTTVSNEPPKAPTTVSIEPPKAPTTVSIEPQYNELNVKATYPTRNTQTQAPNTVNIESIHGELPRNASATQPQAQTTVYHLNTYNMPSNSWKPSGIHGNTRKSGGRRVNTRRKRVNSGRRNKRSRRNNRVA